MCLKYTRSLYMLQQSLKSRLVADLGRCFQLWNQVSWLAAGLPVSTTQVLCGAIMGIGLFEGKGGVNWRTALKVSLSNPGNVTCFAAGALNHPT